MSEEVVENGMSRLYADREHCYCSEKLEEVAQSGSFVKRCRKCGYVFSRHFMEVGTTQELYSGAATDGAYQGAKGSRFTFGISDLRSWLARWRVRRSMMSRPELQKGPGKEKVTILDFGCGQGYCLDALRETGFLGIGIEVCEESARFARQKGSDVRFDLAEIEAGSCDGVIAVHVLEHLPDVDAMLQKIKGVLKPGAYFQFEVPNFDSLCARLFKYHWFHSELELHAHHFTPISFSKILKRHGFVIEKKYYYSLEQGIMGWAQSYLNIFFPYNRFYRRFILNRPWKEKVEALPELFLFPLVSVLAVISYFVERASGSGSVICVEGRIET